MGRGAVGELGEELAERSCHPREAGPVQGDGDPSALRARSALLASRQHTIWSARAATRGLARFALGSSSLAGSLAGTPLSPLARRFDSSFAIVAQRAHGVEVLVNVGHRVVGVSREAAGSQRPTKQSTRRFTYIARPR